MNTLASGYPTLTPQQKLLTQAQLLLVGSTWFASVVYGATSGFFASLYQPMIAALVAASIVLPTLWYFLDPGLRAYIHAVGHRPLMLFHIWRVPAALLFFWFGAQGQLPPVFWILAGVGDFIAGSLAFVTGLKPESARGYLNFHLFGFADFVTAVGTGLTFTLLQEPRMAPLVGLPLALIPLFGVGISGATHLIAFDMLRRGVGMRQN